MSAKTALRKELRAAKLNATNPGEDKEVKESSILSAAREQRRREGKAWDDVTSQQYDVLEQQRQWSLMKHLHRQQQAAYEEVSLERDAIKGQFAHREKLLQYLQSTLQIDSVQAMVNLKGKPYEDCFLSFVNWKHMRDFFENDGDHASAAMVSSYEAALEEMTRSCEQKLRAAEQRFHERIKTKDEICKRLEDKLRIAVTKNTDLEEDIIKIRRGQSSQTYQQKMALVKASGKLMRASPRFTNRRTTNVDVLAANLAALSSENDFHKNQLADVTDEVGALTAEKERVEAELKQLRDSTHSCESTLEQELTDLTFQVKDLNKANETLQTELEEMKILHQEEKALNGQMQIDTEGFDFGESISQLSPQHVRCNDPASPKNNPAIIPLLLRNVKTLISGLQKGLTQKQALVRSVDGDAKQSNHMVIGAVSSRLRQVEDTQKRSLTSFLTDLQALKGVCHIEVLGGVLTEFISGVVTKELEFGSESITAISDRLNEKRLMSGGKTGHATPEDTVEKEREDEREREIEDDDDPVSRSLHDVVTSAVSAPVEALYQTEITELKTQLAQLTEEHHDMLQQIEALKQEKVADEAVSQEQLLQEREKIAAKNKEHGTILNAFRAVEKELKDIRAEESYKISMRGEKWTSTYQDQIEEIGDGDLPPNLKQAARLLNKSTQYVRPINSVSKQCQTHTKRTCDNFTMTTVQGEIVATPAMMALSTSMHPLGPPPLPSAVTQPLEKMTPASSLRRGSFAESYNLEAFLEQQIEPDKNTTDTANTAHTAPTTHTTTVEDETDTLSDPAAASESLVDSCAFNEVDYERYARYAITGSEDPAEPDPPKPQRASSLKDAISQNRTISTDANVPSVKADPPTPKERRRRLQVTDEVPVTSPRRVNIGEKNTEQCPGGERDLPLPLDPKERNGGVGVDHANYQAKQDRAATRLSAPSHPAQGLKVENMKRTPFVVEPEGPRQLNLDFLPYKLAIVPTIASGDLKVTAEKARKEVQPINLGIGKSALLLHSVVLSSHGDQLGKAEVNPIAPFPSLPTHTVLVRPSSAPLRRVDTQPTSLIVSQKAVCHKRKGERI